MLIIQSLTMSFLRQQSATFLSFWGQKQRAYNKVFPITSCPLHPDFIKRCKNSDKEKQGLCCVLNWNRKCNCTLTSKIPTPQPHRNQISWLLRPINAFHLFIHPRSNPNKNHTNKNKNLACWCWPILYHPTKDTVGTHSIQMDQFRKD